MILVPRNLPKATFDLPDSFVPPRDTTFHSASDKAPAAKVEPRPSHRTSLYEPAFSNGEEEIAFHSILDREGIAADMPLTDDIFPRDDIYARYVGSPRSLPPAYPRAASLLPPPPPSPPILTEPKYPKDKKSPTNSTLPATPAAPRATSTMRAATAASAAATGTAGAAGSSWP